MSRMSLHPLSFVNFHHLYTQLIIWYFTIHHHCIRRKHIMAEGIFSVLREILIRLDSAIYIYLLIYLWTEVL